MKHDIKHNPRVVDAQREVDAMRALVTDLIAMDVPALAINLAQRKLSKARRQRNAALAAALDERAAAMSEYDRQKRENAGIERLMAMLYPEVAR